MTEFIVGYQMQAEGSYAFFSSVAKISSRVVYTNKEAITDEVIEEFKKVCMTPLNEDDMWYMSEVTKFKILELQII